jgi:hypothetical protein
MASNSSLSKHKEHFWISSAVVCGLLALYACSCIQQGWGAQAASLPPPCASLLSTGCRGGGPCLVEEEGEVGQLDGLVQVSILADDERRLPTQLQSDALQTTSRCSIKLQLAQRHERQKLCCKT